MPDSRQFIDDGLSAERAGALDRALHSYNTAIQWTDDPDVHAEAYTRIADVHREHSSWDDGLAAARTAQEIARKAGLERRLADATIAEANVLMARGDFAAAMPIFQAIAGSSTDPRVRGIVLQNTASMLAQLGRYDSARTAFEESRRNFEEAGYVRGQVIALNNLGRLALDQKDLDAAVPLLERALSAATELGDSELVAIASENLGTALCERGDTERAHDLGTAALGYFTAANNRIRQLECLRLVGDIHARSEELDAARRCYERALEVATEIEADVEIQVTRHRLRLLQRDDA